MGLREVVVGVLRYPAHLSTPVTLTLALSRRAGEGIYPIASPGSVVFNPLSRGRALFRLR